MQLVQSILTYINRHKTALIPMALIIVIVAFSADSCGTQQDATQTTNNQNAIISAQPMPAITYSQRRWVLTNYYGQILNKPRLRTCTMITTRGGGNTDIIGIADTLGMPVNLSNQVTTPGQSEPDSVYQGTNDQTVLVLRNGRIMVAEADTNAMTGDCGPGLHPNTMFQKEIDYQESLPPAKSNDPNGVNFCAANHGNNPNC